MIFGLPRMKMMSSVVVHSGGGDSTFPTGFETHQTNYTLSNNPLPSRTRQDLHELSLSDMD